MGGSPSRRCTAFRTSPSSSSDGLYWDVLRLHHEVLAGLRHASRSAPDLRSVGIDTWGVDVGFLDAAKSLVGNPVHHRDPRNLPAVERVHARIDPAALYARNGLQVMPFNTLYQLEAARRTPAFGIVRHVLPLPDLLGYWLTGVVIAERTHASTTGLLGSTDPRLGRGARPAAGARPHAVAAARRPGHGAWRGAARGPGGDRAARNDRRDARRVARHRVGGRRGPRGPAGIRIHLVRDVVSGGCGDAGADPHRGEPGGELHQRGRGRRDALGSSATSPGCGCSRSRSVPGSARASRSRSRRCSTPLRRCRGEGRPSTPTMRPS